jgi:hypothetical protein
MVFVLSVSFSSSTSGMIKLKFVIRGVVRKIYIVVFDDCPTILGGNAKVRVIINVGRSYMVRLDAIKPAWSMLPSLVSGAIAPVSLCRWCSG